MLNATFDNCDLNKFCRLDELGLEAIGQCLEPGRVVLAGQVVKPDDWCHRGGSQGTPRGTVICRFTHEPLGWRPTPLRITVRRYRCAECAHVWRQDTTAVAEPSSNRSRPGCQLVLLSCAGWGER